MTHFHKRYHPIWVGHRNVARAILPVIGVLIPLAAALPVYAQQTPSFDMTYHYDGPRVTDDDVYRNPDDRMLNLNYARQQAAKGELLSASSALERLLYQEPNWHSARLFYAAILYRLDDKQAALRELSLLESRTLNDYQQAVYDDYVVAFQYTPPVTAQTTIDGLRVQDITKKKVDKVAIKKAAPLSARFSTGLRADSNAGNALVDVNVGQDNRGDISAFAEGALRAIIPFNDDSNYAFVVGVNGQTRRHETFKQADFDTLGGRAGLSMTSGSVRLFGDLNIDEIYISGESYLSQFGPRIGMNIDVSPQTVASVSLGRYDQDFKNLTAAPNERRRSGDKTLLLGSLSHRFDNNVRLRGDIGYENKSAEDISRAYDAIRFGAAASIKNSAGIITRAHVRYRRLNYDAPANTIRPDDIETRLNAYASVAAPWRMFMTKESQKESWVGDTMLEVGLNYNKREPEDGRRAFENIGVEFRATANF